DYRTEAVLAVVESAVARDDDGLAVEHVVVVLDVSGDLLDRDSGDATVRRVLVQQDACHWHRDFDHAADDAFDASRRELFVDPKAGLHFGGVMPEQILVRWRLFRYLEHVDLAPGGTFGLLPIFLCRTPSCGYSSANSADLNW